MGTMREDSKINWNSNKTIEEINAGSFQRIADAAEKMAGNYIMLQNDNDRIERNLKKEREKNLILRRRISALQGVITKLKKKK